ncbi:ROK family protein [Stieleria marina]|uniref:ROK family protein n=1 Tax=Stieleria marina TaxID=1930275 RepID=UPI003AF38D70
MSHTASSTDDLYLGIDVGGTDVKIGLVNAGGTLIDSHRTPTPELGSPERVFAFAIDYADKQLSKLGLQSEQLKAVGLAVPGVLDTEQYVLREVVNLPGWLGVKLLDTLCAASQLPSAVVNDANSAAYAEHSLRKLDRQSLALVTLGTGIGSGVVIAGNPHGGDHGCAGELGHIAVDFGPDAIKCTCGSSGHLESYAGARGVVARLRKAIELIDQESLPKSLMGKTITPRDIASAAESGHAISRNVIIDTGRFVGRAIGMIGQVADPAVVLLGGAMTFGGDDTEVGRQFIQAVRDSVTATTLVQVGGNIKIEFATLGNNAGMLGAAMVAKQTVS